MLSRRLACAVLSLLTVTSLMACSGDDEPDASASSPAPEDVLAAAQQTLDDTSGVHIELEGTDLPTDGTVVLEASGDAQHPASFEGDVRVRLAGIAATVAVVSIDGTMWAKLPFTTGYAETDPKQLGVGDPGALIRPGTGVSALLTSGTDVTKAGEVRIGNEVLDEYVATLPGDAVDPLLPLSDATATVEGRFAIEASSGELRRAVLTGPFYAGGDQTYSLTLDDYGADVDISAPD